MYIDKELLIQILSIIVTVIHIIIYLILFYKLHKIKANTAVKPTMARDLLDKVKAAGNKLLTLLSPLYPNIVGLIKKVTSEEKQEGDSQEDGNDSKGKG